jgi:hypothetical protein
MFGLIYEAPGVGPHPTALVLHGFPGNERNLDLAQAIRRAGWNAVFFHYRGAWGSEGSFGFVHVLEDRGRTHHVAAAGLRGTAPHRSIPARTRGPQHGRLRGAGVGRRAARRGLRGLAGGWKPRLWAEAARTPAGEAGWRVRSTAGVGRSAARAGPRSWPRCG